MTRTCLETISSYRTHNFEQIAQLRINGFQEAMLPYVETVNGSSYINGFLGDIWTLVQEKFRFRSEIVVVDFDTGYEMLDHGEVDVFLSAGISNSIENGFSSNEVHSQPYIRNWYLLYVKQPEGQPSSMSHLHTFTKLIWYSILFSFVALTLTLWITLKVLRKFQIREPPLSMFTCFLGVVSGFINQGVDLRLRSLSARLLQLSATVLGVMLYISMNAVLFSKLSRQDVVLPFATIEDIIYKRTQSICIRKDSFALESIKDEWEEQFGKQEDVINLNCPDIRNQEDILRAICEDDLVVLESSQVMLSLLKKKIMPCTIANADRRYFITGNVYITHKRFKEVALIENFIKTLRSAGIIKKLEKKWLATNYVNARGIISSDSHQVDFRHVRGIYFIYTVLATVSMILLAAEIIWNKVKPKLEHQSDFIE